MKQDWNNGLQLGAVCVGLWEGNCAKVLLCVWFKKEKKEGCEGFLKLWIN
jgi:hypothetical protein